ncbi:hypothetical protein M413DRAFT_125504 [Hebeloma cylindrosporum]|uniref:Uncharacterized protein n=1 Tax=Hebeloma cylindrosporum TaxID=76867 RepID=A0A0C2YPC8_HEBCY|nr:hypothetical protein M413DRAFT_125504 [Hebeloma cylindrosporum h7]
MMFWHRTETALYFVYGLEFTDANAPNALTSSIQNRGDDPRILSLPILSLCLALHQPISASGHFIAHTYNSDSTSIMHTQNLHPLLPILTDEELNVPLITGMGKQPSG